MLVYLLILASACEVFSAINHQKEMVLLELMRAGEKLEKMPEGMAGAALRNTISMVSFGAAVIMYPLEVFPYMLPVFCLAIAQFFLHHKKITFFFVADYSITAVCYFLAAAAIRNA